MSEWPSRTLGEICAEGGGFIRTGPFGSQLHRSDYTDDPDGIPVVMPKNMSGGRIDLADIARIDTVTAERLSQHLLVENDVVLSRRGDVGRSAWIAKRDLPAFCGTGSMRVHLGQSVSVHPEYLRYFFRSTLSSDYLEGHAVGATMPNLNASIVSETPVPVPPLDVQERVARVLSSFDDLIENNRRRIELLESMARAIYREWFVHFRFPGHEDVPMVDSALGPIPEGWTWRALGELIELGKETVDPQSIDPETPAVGLEHIPRRQIILDAWGKAGDSGSRKLIFCKGDVLFGKIRPYFHKVSVAPVSGICSTDTFVIRSVAEHWGQVVAVVTDDDLVAHAVQTSNGTKMPRANWQVLEKWLVAVPDASVGKQFTEFMRSHLGLAETLMFENRQLSGLRDLLLPKLVTGEIDVSGLDVDGVIAEAVA